MTTNVPATVKPATGTIWKGLRQRGGSHRLHLLLVGALTAAAAAGYSAYGLILHYTYSFNSYDLVIFDQAVRSYAHFQPGISIIKGVHNGFGPHFSVLGDHWSPVLAVLAPLYWLYNGPQDLLVAQSVLFALAIPPLWLYTRRALGGGRQATAAAYLVAVAYGLSWPLAEAAHFGFHEVAFAPVLTALGLERLQAGRVRSGLLALAALLLVKEDMGLLIAGLGVSLAIGTKWVPRQRLIAAGLVVAGLAGTMLTTYLLIPAFGGRASYYWSYSALGSSVPQVGLHLLTHPVSSLHLLITPQVKLHTMLWLLAMFCFLPLLSPLSLAVVPLLLERMLGAKFPAWWSVHYQYNAYLVIILACAAVDGAARLGRWAAWARQRAGSGSGGPGTAIALACAAAMCAVAVLLVPRFALGDALHRAFYHRSARMTAAAAAVAAVPSGVTVEAAGSAGPHLSSRDTVLLWDGEHAPLWAPWVLADVARGEFTFGSVQAQQQRVALLRRHGYQVVFERRGYLVLHRASGPAGKAHA
jgi:uncharacterized membrane protein